MGMVVNSYWYNSGLVGAADITNYSYTGTFAEYTVPSGMTKATVLLWGGGGGGGSYTTTGAQGGPGGVLQATFPVAAGDTLKVEVGQGGRGGVGGTAGGAGGWPDGGGGARGDVYCGGGGGSSRFYVNGTLKAVAGAGGGATWGDFHAGAGGGTTGGTGVNGSGTTWTITGSGGSQVAGGLDLNDTGNTTKKGVGIPSVGTSARTGGWGGTTGNTTTSTSDDGGGGGGGYYGGGGGGGDGQCGGGGSSWTDSDASSVTHWQAKIKTPAFAPEGSVEAASGGSSVSSGTANHGGDGHVRIILHSGTKECGGLGVASTPSATLTYNFVANEKTTIPVTVPAGGIWVRELQIELAPTVSAGDKFRGAIYNAISGAGVKDTNDTLVAVSADYTVVSGDSRKFIPLQFSTPVFLSAGNYWMGVHVSGGTDSAAVSATARATSGDTFSDGTNATYGSSSDFAAQPRITIPYSTFDPS